MADLILPNKEVAKELLRKGILLNDPELIEMANKLLGDAKEEPKVVIEEKTKKGRGRKKKVAAPEPEIEQPIKLDQSSYITTVKKAGTTPKSRVRITPDGKQEGVYTRSEPLNIKIEAVDTGEFKNDKANKKLKKFTVPITNMPERKSSLVEVRCAGPCNKTFKVSAMLIRDEGYTCDKCIMKRGAR